VYYKGTSLEWNDIAINSDGNDSLTNATRYYFTSNGASEITQGNWWYYDTDGATIIEMVLYAISFNLNGGSGVIDDQIIENGKKIGKPDDPTRDGYTFSGWYYNGEEWSFDNVIDSSMELEAKWTINSYILTLNTDSEKGEVTGANTYEYNSDVTIKAIPKSCYIFDGWYKDGVKMDYGQEATFKMPSKDITLEARYNNVFEYDSENPTKIIGLKYKNLTNLVIPEGVTEIGSKAFRNCSNLTSITLPNSLTSIGDHAFQGCTCEILWKDNPSITEIGDFAFNSYNGTSITIPNSITSIKSGAFYDCSNLSKVYYKGTPSQWNDITIDSSFNDPLTNATRYYFTNNGASEMTVGNWWYYDTDGVTIIEKVVE